MYITATRVCAEKRCGGDGSPKNALGHCVCTRYMLWCMVAGNYIKNTASLSLSLRSGPQRYSAALRRCSGRFGSHMFRSGHNARTTHGTRDSLIAFVRVRCLNPSLCLFLTRNIVFAEHCWCTLHSICGFLQTAPAGHTAGHVMRLGGLCNAHFVKPPAQWTPFVHTATATTKTVWPKLLLPGCRAAVAAAKRVCKCIGNRLVRFAGVCQMCEVRQQSGPFHYV